MLRLLPAVRKIPPALPVTSCNVPKHEINTRERNRKPAERPRAPNFNVALALMVITLNLMLSEPPSFSVDNDTPGAVKSSQSSDEHTSEVGAAPPSHVLSSLNEPVWSAMNATRPNVLMLPSRRTPKVNGPERLEPKLKLAPRLPDAGTD